MILAIALVGAARLRVETSTDSVLDRTDPAWAFYKRSVEQFGNDEIIVLAWSNESPYAPAALEKVADLTEALEGTPHTRRVDSLYSVPLVRSAPNGDLDLSPGLDRKLLNREDVSATLAHAYAVDRIAPGSLVSKDGRTFAVNLHLADAAEENYASLLAELRRQIGNANVWISGVPIFRWNANLSTRRQLALFGPITVIMVGLALFCFFRSIRAVLVPLIVASTGSVFLLGVMGFLDTPLTITTAILPTIILALGCAYVMHVLCAVQRTAEPGELRDAVVGVALPIALSGLTTAIGFVAVSLVRIDAIRYVGGYGALGVVAVLVLSLSAAPALLAVWPLPTRGSSRPGTLVAFLGERVVLLAERRKVLLLAIWLIALAATASGVHRVIVETDATKWYKPGTFVRDSYEAIRANLSGISPMNVVIETTTGGLVTEPQCLRAIDRLTAHLEGLPEVGKAVSFADPLRQINGGFLGDHSYPLPLDQALVEQYLLLLESLEQLGDLVSDDRAAANVLLRVSNNGSAHLRWVAEEAERWWRENGPAGYHVQTTGIMYEFARAQDEIARGQIRGLGFAIGAISVVLFGIFGSSRISIAALVSNAIPIAMLFGIMGVLGVPLDAGTVLVGSFALGVAVDDTIHLATAYQQARGSGQATSDALRYAIAKVVEPLVYTTVVVSLGFVVLGISEFTFTRNLGLLTASVMILCLVADLFLLPALLCVGGSDSRFSKRVPANPGAPGEIKG